MAYPLFISPGITDVGEEALARGWSGEGIWGFLLFPVFVWVPRLMRGPEGVFYPCLKIFLAFFGINISF